MKDKIDSSNSLKPQSSDQSRNEDYVSNQNKDEFENTVDNMPIKLLDKLSTDTEV